MTEVIDAYDLSSYYYLRRPGRYAVTFRPSDGLSPSNTLRFQVETDDAATADGDPLGKLLSLDSVKWTLVGSPNVQASIRPGRSRAETAGWQFAFVDKGRGFKGSTFRVWLWLTDKPAEIVQPSNNENLPASEYLGKVSRWHAYFYASPDALAVWPLVKEDLIRVLER